MLSLGKKTWRTDFFREGKACSWGGGHGGVYRANVVEVSTTTANVRIKDKPLNEGLAFVGMMFLFPVNQGHGGWRGNEGTRRER